MNEWLKNYEEIMNSKDIGSALIYLQERAKTIREYNLLLMIEEEWTLKEYYGTDNTQRDVNKTYFNGRCPYTDKPCEDWNCYECKVEQEEREYLKERYYDRT